LRSLSIPEKQAGIFTQEVNCVFVWLPWIVDPSKFATLMIHHVVEYDLSTRLILKSIRIPDNDLISGITRLVEAYG